MGEPGFVVSVNGRELVAVSCEGLNILTVRLHGDVLGEELASIELFGGLYGEGDESKHLIWLNDYVVLENDEVEITFSESVISSRAGKTIDELHPGGAEAMGPWQSTEKIFEDLAQRRRVREHLTFEVEHSSGAVKRCESKPNDFSLGLSAMWKRLKNETASIWISSNSLEGIRDQTNGTGHARARISFGESVKVRVET